MFWMTRGISNISMIYYMTVIILQLNGIEIEKITLFNFLIAFKCTSFEKFNNFSLPGNSLKVGW